jgi:GTPase Era involved in 16S rRNA processing
MVVGRRLESCTTELGLGYIETIEGHPLLKEYRIVLIDTPGFDDTHKTDFAILEKIATWLENSYAVLKFYKAR